MRAFFTLVRRELSGYFSSFTGYLVIAAVLLLLGLSFAEMISKLSAYPTYSPMSELFFATYYFWLILLLTAPVMTMRAFSQEKFSGTYETLMTTPVSDLQVVLSKFTGSLLFYLFTWIPFLAYVLTAQFYSNRGAAVSPEVLASTFLGLLLIGALYMSLGCFASALTQSQIIAAITSYVLGLALFVLSLRAVFSDASDGMTAQVFDYVSMPEHMQDFARGIIDTRPVIFYLSLIVLFLFLTLKVVESRRWK